MILQNIWGKNNQECFLRKEFNVKSDFSKGIIRIFVDTGYELYINGRFVAAVDEWANTRDYDISIFIRKGKNLIAIHGVNHSGHRGCAAEVVIDGKTIAVTDETWKLSDVELWGWFLNDYDDSTWESPVVRNMSAAGDKQWWTRPGDDNSRIIPTYDNSMFFCDSIPKGCRSPFYTEQCITDNIDAQLAEFMGEEYVEYRKSPTLPNICFVKEIINNKKVINDKILISKTERYTGENFIADFGREIVGFFRMKISSKSSVSVRVRFAETLDEVMIEPSRDTLLDRMLKEEYRIFNGVHEFECRTRQAFRYVYIEFFDCESEVTVSDLSARTCLYPVKKVGYFSCSDKDMTKVWEMGTRTLHFCMQEYYLDAPKRDRFLWTGDARLEALINYYTFGDTKLFEFSWEQLEKVQLPNGGIPSSYGEGLSMLWDFVAWYVIAYYDYYMHTGNLDFVLRHRESLDKAVHFLIDVTDETGLINVPSNPLGNLWMVELNEATGYDPYLNELYLRCIQIATLFAEKENDNIKRSEYIQIAKKIESKICDFMNNGDLKKLYDNTFHTQLQFEMAEYDLNSGNIDKMIERIRKYWCCMISSGSDCLHECTNRTGMLDRIDKNNGRASYGSYCHAWTGAATVLLPMGVAGIKPIEPGFTKVLIKPHTKAFKSFKCVVPTPLGEIAIKYSDHKLEYCLPLNMSGVLEINNSKYQIRKKGHIEVSV